LSANVDDDVVEWMLLLKYLLLGDAKAAGHSPDAFAVAANALGSAP